MSPPRYLWHTTQHRRLIFHSHGWGLYSSRRWLLYGCAAPRCSQAITRGDTSFQCLVMDWFTLPILLLVHTASTNTSNTDLAACMHAGSSHRWRTQHENSRLSRKNEKSNVSSFRPLIGIWNCAIKCLYVPGLRMPNGSSQMFPPS